MRRRLLDGFALAAAEVCRRLEPFKDVRGATLDEVVDAVLTRPAARSSGQRG